MAKKLMLEVPEQPSEEVAGYGRVGIDSKIESDVPVPGVNRRAGMTETFRWLAVGRWAGAPLGAARELGMARNTLYRRMKELGISRRK